MTDYFSQLPASVAIALAEDVGSGDITAELISADVLTQAEIITRERAILCGKPWVDEVLRQVDPSLKITWHGADGDEISQDQPLVTIAGCARHILTAERTALNFLQTLSGTATATAHYIDLISHTNTQLLDTRKTLPGLRRAQKYAVTCGSGMNHRMGLYDAFLLKENHIAACGSIAAAVARARYHHPERKIEVEVENLTEFHEAIDANPDWIMLDNFSLLDLNAVVAMNHTQVKLEASGGIESDHELIAIAETGVDFISVGALTKNCRAIDLSMRLVG